ncbi:MAG: hypothetical protein JST82_11855 [Bacteroidetes bacterium]|nr:hypothetical protein [Bacteroidota bacterium]
MNLRPAYKATMTALATSLFLCSGSMYVKAQSNVEVFGQNRIQYRKFEWKYFDTKHFRIYHYDAAGRNLARYVAEQVENDIRIVEQRMGGEFPHKFKIIVYNNFDEYRQTNIGRKFDSQLQDIPAGTVDILGDKLVVYYTGVHADLRRQTRAGMSRVVMERMLFGENFREMVRNAVLMNMPSWTVYGFTSYLVDGWDTKSNSDWKNMLEGKRKPSFYDLAEKQPELAGKAFWKYIADKYGDAQMKNLLFAMQSKSNLNQGVKMALGQNIKQTYDSAIAYYKMMYAKDNLVEEMPDSTKNILEIKIPNDGTVLRNVQVSPSGSDVSYVTWKNGEYKVWLKNTRGEKVASAILDGGQFDYNEPADPDYPLVAWSNNGYKLAVLYRRGRVTLLRIYNSYTARVENYRIPDNRFDRALSMAFNEDDDRLVFSAIKKSQTDLYEFIIRGAKMKNITNDAWDDVQPAFISGGSRRGIMFLSNRPKPNLDVPLAVNQLPAGPMNVFFYNTRTKRKQLIQMSHVTSGNVAQPIQYGTENYAYLYDENGILNQYLVLLNRTANNMDSATAIPVTNYSRNIVTHQFNPLSTLVTDVIQVGNTYKVYYKPQLLKDKAAVPKVLEETSLLKTEKNKNITDALKPEKEDVNMNDGNTFRSEFKDESGDKGKRNKIGQDNNDAEINIVQAADSEYLKMKAQPYRLALKPDFFSVRVDNSVLFNKYQAVAQTGGRYINPQLGGMLTASLYDLMENYRITGGLRLPIDFNGMTYFMQYENAKRRVDWSLLYLRAETGNTYNVAYVDQLGNLVTVNEQLGRNVTSIYQGTVSYPFDRMRSLRLNLGYRTDILRFKAQDTLSLKYEMPNKRQNWMMSRVEYVFDNTVKPTMNIYYGARYKIFGEYLYSLDGSGGLYNIGADFRYYKKIYKNFIWASRFVGATSGGKMKILYHVGGVDNWINSQYNSNVPLRAGEKYAFETLGTNVRGYEQNSFNGNTYGIINTEFRLPLLTTFIKRPIQSSILKNLQLVAFGDIGSAWQGLWPLPQRVVNNRTLPAANNPAASQQVVLTIYDEKNGVGIGYGGGLRTMIFGYFLRFDAAWNVENRKKDPLFYFSIGTDF